MSDQEDGVEFDWVRGADQVAVPHRRAIAVHTNPAGDVVVRHLRDFDENEDPYIVIPVTARFCPGPFQDALVRETVTEIERVFAAVAKRRGVDESDLRTWVAWSAMRLPAPEQASGGEAG